MQIICISVYVCLLRFVEHGEHRGHLYGTSTDAIDEVLDQGRVCVIDVEPHVSLSEEDHVPFYTCNMSICVGLLTIITPITHFTLG